jgi:hypothetical protein
LAGGRDVVLAALDGLDRDGGDLADIDLLAADDEFVRAISRPLKMRSTVER